MNLQEQISRIQSMMRVIKEDINFDDITFFKTTQGSKYIRMPDGRLRRWKSYHSNTGGEDQGLHGWSDMSVFVDPQFDKEANAVQFLIGNGYKVGLSKSKNGKMVIVIFDNNGWRAATWKDAYPNYIKQYPDKKDKPLAWDYVKEPTVGYNVVDFNIKNDQLKGYHFGSEVSEVSEFTDEDKKLFFPSYFYMNLQEQISRIQSMMGVINEEAEQPILNDLGEKHYIDWDENYGNSFKVVRTPEGAQTGGEWNPDLTSIVTPENTNAWYEWEELPEEKLMGWKENWDGIQKGLGVHKYNQIVRSM